MCLLLAFYSSVSAQAPGDEDELCTSNRTTADATERVLMDSYNYINLLQQHGSVSPLGQNTVWREMSFDEQDLSNSPEPTRVSFSAGIQG